VKNQLNLAQKQKFLINFAYFITIITFLYILLKFAFSYFLPFVIGVTIAYLVQKPSVFLSKKLKIKKEICAAFLSVLIYIIVVLVLALVLFLCISNFNKLIEFLSSAIKEIKTFTSKISNIFDGFLSKNNFFADISLNNLLNKISEVITAFVAKVIKTIPNFLISSVVTVVATCYISKDYDKLKKFLFGMIQKKTSEKIVKIKSIFIENVLKLISGYLLLSMITFFVLLIGFFVLKKDNFLFLAFLIALIDLLPVIGAGTVLLPWAVFAFLEHNYSFGFSLIFLYFTMCIIRNFLEPQIIGKRIGLNPIFTLFSIFLGLKVAGISGVIIFPTILLVVYDYYRKKFYGDNLTEHGKQA